MTQPLDTLTPGTRFRVPGTSLVGALLSLSSGAARVRYDADTIDYGPDDGGMLPARSLNISRKTEVERI